MKKIYITLSEQFQHSIENHLLLQHYYIVFHSIVHFFPVLVKGLYQTESDSLHVMQLIRI
jgi:hypothetical protein